MRIQFSRRFQASGKWVAYSLIYLAVLLWFVYSFQKNLPSLYPTNFLETFGTNFGGIFSTIADLVRRWGLIDIPWVVCLWITAYILGKKFLNLLGITLDSGAERTWLYSTVGLSLLSLTLFLLAVLRVLHRGEAYALLILPPILWFSETRRLVAQVRNIRAWLTLPRPFSAETLAQFFLIAFAATRCIISGSYSISGPRAERNAITKTVAT